MEDNVTGVVVEAVIGGMVDKVVGHRVGSRTAVVGSGIRKRIRMGLGSDLTAKV